MGLHARWLELDFPRIAAIVTNECGLPLIPDDCSSDGADWAQQNSSSDALSKRQRFLAGRNRFEIRASALGALNLPAHGYLPFSLQMRLCSSAVTSIRYLMAVA